MNCRKCRKRLKSGAQYCDFCGTWVTGDEPPVKIDRSGKPDKRLLYAVYILFIGIPFLIIAIVLFPYVFPSPPRYTPEPPPPSYAAPAANTSRPEPSKPAEDAGQDGKESSVFGDFEDIDFYYSDYLRYDDQYKDTPVMLLASVAITHTGRDYDYIVNTFVIRGETAVPANRYLIYDGRTGTPPKLIQADFVLVKGLYTGAQPYAGNDAAAVRMTSCELLDADKTVSLYNELGFERVQALDPDESADEKD